MYQLLRCCLAGLLFPAYLAAQTSGQASGVVTLAGVLTFPGKEVYDIWGYEDPTTGTPYALVGWTDGLLIVDVRDPEHPTLTAELNDVPGFDVKVWRHYAYTVTGRFGTAAIIDLSDPAHPRQVGDFISAHNIFIDERGFLYTEGPGLFIYDLNPDPEQPQLLYDSGDAEGHDATVRGALLYDFHGLAGTFLYDVSDPTLPQRLAAITDPRIFFHHSGWPTEDGRYLFLCDELARDTIPDITVWDLGDLARPTRVATVTDPDATVHNLYVIGDLAYVSYYTAGFRVYDVSDPTRPVEVGAFDTDPGTGDGFGGAFGAYPFTSSGYIYVSGTAVVDGTTTGSLHVFYVDASALPIAAEPTPDLPGAARLYASAPNPFTDATTIRYDLPRSVPVVLRIFDVQGREVARPVDAVQEAGPHAVTWHAGTSPGGVYFYRLQTPGGLLTHTMVHLR